MFHLQDKEPGAERGSDSLAGARGPGGAAARLPCPAPSAPAGLAAAGNSVLSLVGLREGAAPKCGRDGFSWTVMRASALDGLKFRGFGEGIERLWPWSLGLA